MAQERRPCRRALLTNGLTVSPRYRSAMRSGAYDEVPVGIDLPGKRILVATCLQPRWMRLSQQVADKVIFEQEEAFDSRGRMSAVSLELSCAALPWTTASGRIRPVTTSSQSSWKIDSMVVYSRPSNGAGWRSAGCGSHSAAGEAFRRARSEPGRSARGSEPGNAAPPCRLPSVART